MKTQSNPSEPVRPYAPDASSFDPVSVEPVELIDPLLPKWSEMLSQSPIRSLNDQIPPLDTQIRRADKRSNIVSKRTLDDEIQRVAAQHCEACVWVTAIRGGEPISVSRCMGCGTIDWDDIRKQADAYARRYAARLLEETYGHFDYPDGSRRIAWEEGKPRMINVQQVYNLFTRDPGQDGCSHALGDPEDCK